MKVDFTNGDCFIIDADDGIYWKFDTTRNKTFKNIMLNSTLVRGQWIEFTGNNGEEIIQKAIEGDEVILKKLEPSQNK